MFHNPVCRTIMVMNLLLMLSFRMALSQQPMPPTGQPIPTAVAKASPLQFDVQWKNNQIVITSSIIPTGTSFPEGLTTSDVIVNYNLTSSTFVNAPETSFPPLASQNRIIAYVPDTTTGGSKGINVTLTFPYGNGSWLTSDAKMLEVKLHSASGKFDPLTLDLNMEVISGYINAKQKIDSMMVVMDKAPLLQAYVTVTDNAILVNAVAVGAAGRVTAHLIKNDGTETPTDAVFLAADVDPSPSKPTFSFNSVDPTATYTVKITAKSPDFSKDSDALTIPQTIRLLSRQSTPHFDQSPSVTATDTDIKVTLNGSDATDFKYTLFDTTAGGAAVKVHGVDGVIAQLPMPLGATSGTVSNLPIQVLLSPDHTYYMDFTPIRTTGKFPSPVVQDIGNTVTSPPFKGIVSKILNGVTLQFTTTGLNFVASTSVNANITVTPDIDPGNLWSAVSPTPGTTATAQVNYQNLSDFRTALDKDKKKPVGFNVEVITVEPNPRT